MTFEVRIENVRTMPVLARPKTTPPSSSHYSTSSSESPIATPTFRVSFQYDGSSSDDGFIPKIEELNDSTDDGKASMEDEGEVMSNGIEQKKPRGRPRKVQVEPPANAETQTKGRTKTGCLTCRQRKKKCDETKPFCIHCQKNNYYCVYRPKEHYKSGKKTANRARKSISISPRELPVLIQGVETDLDRLFLDHFNYNVSRVLTLFTDKHNPFKELLLPMALRHRGLMHSLLCLSGSHLTAREDNPSFNDRQHHHFQCAIKNLGMDKNVAARIAGDSTAMIDDPTVAQTLVLCLRSICAGEVNGEYRPHLDAAKHLIRTQKSPNYDFQNFLFEFFIYHDVSNSITALDRASIFERDDFELPEFMIQPEAGALLGVFDGLFLYISKIRRIRDRIRGRLAMGLRPLVDYETLSDAQAIDAGLRSWVCTQPAGSPRFTASMLYRQCTWLYLHRTILSSQHDDNLWEAVDEGLEYVRQLPSDSSTQSILLMPVFLLGCSAFDKNHRPDIERAFESLQAYSNLGNIFYARKVVHKVWELMDGGDPNSWDWETIIKDMGWDFLVT